MNDDNPTPERPAALRWPILVVRYAAVGFGSALAAILGVAALTVVEGFWARGKLLRTRSVTPTGASGPFGEQYDGQPLHLVLMGDSLAVGYGSDTDDQTVGVVLAKRLAEVAKRPVRLDNVAEVGAESTDLLAQLIAVGRMPSAPDVVVIIVGGNDAMHLKPLADALHPLRATIGELRRMGARVVVGTCPDLGTVRSFFEPLRFFAHWLSRLLATSQTIVALRAGARTVSLADSLGPLFRRDPTSMFSAMDRLHPSGLGYVNAAEVLFPSVRAAAGYPAKDGPLVPYRVYDKTSSHPLAWLAFRASRRAGVRLRHAKDVAPPAA
ncbi:SGNH/GDSL hydrolase family protein [Humibacter sp.]|jgi:lysophospholipase L1-like esterase|uniref:SGNH/GDSL hydrolase family protein n=1 Tax=Humibacter sp. TaxID=1940291 RepID=UPI002B69D1A6|nr:SGNH/GDSL hydrolase family protein [Humibacter sp.]HVX07339.1 SGNH/GDSL hydrolase family protein [Humibacter sp.]